jgi:RNA polymerase sigma factor (sigma-70 family)
MAESLRDVDRDSFGELIEPYRRELHAHCYRMLGSVHDADDALQEALLGAWKGLSGFEGRSSLRSWLYTIATHASLRILEPRAVRARVARVLPPRTLRQRPPRQPALKPLRNLGELDHVAHQAGDPICRRGGTRIAPCPRLGLSPRSRDLVATKGC